MKNITNIDGMPNIMNFGISHVSSIENPKEIAFITGQMGNDENGVFGTTFREQVEMAFGNLEKALKASGFKVSQVAKINCYLTNFEEKNLQALKSIRLDFFSETAPASTLVGVAFLINPSAQFEVDAIAVR